LKKTNKQIITKCKKIKILATDVDGVLTDGGMYYSEAGETLKKFNTRDGMAVEILSSIGIETIFITRENSKIVKKRAKKVKAIESYIGILNKEKKLKDICKKYKLESYEIAYVGDDINDLEIIKKVGFSCCPLNAMDIIKENVDYISTKNGGEGVFREIADMIYFNKQKKSK
jgi:YrbI family 3-deoxy-D-manno-octulosonate 8-phosphate phosphatase